MLNATDTGTDFARVTLLLVLVKSAVEYKISKRAERATLWVEFQIQPHSITEGQESYDRIHHVVYKYFLGLAFTSVVFKCSFLD